MSRQEILNTLKEIQLTRMVYFGYVYEDQDEMVLGRLRIIPIVKPNQTFTQAIEEEGVNNLEKNKWDKDKDEYLFLPLLPYEINPVALKGELVLLLYGDKSYPQQNKFYVKSLVSSPSALELENYQKSQSNYAEGTRVESSLSPKNNQGEYRNEKIKGIYPEPGDNALLGRGSADIIVKRDEVLIRAGKTQGLNPETLSQGYQNRAFLQLSNFKQTKVNKDPETKIQVNEIVKSVKKMVIWNIDNLENTQDAFNGWVRLVKIINSTDVTNTKNFKLDTITKLSVGTDYTNPEAEVVFNTKTKEEITKIFNDFINGVLYGNINLPDYQITKQVSDQFPLVVTPSYATYTSGFSLSESVTTNDVAELRNFSEFFSKVKVNQNKFEYGWILVPKPPVNGKVVTGPLSDIKTETVTPSDFVQSPTTYGILGAQKLYLLSPTIQGAPRGDINLSDTLYGIQQPKFVGDEKSLEYQTYPTVRGDQLMILLRKIFEFVKGHVHPVATMQPIPVSAGNGQTTQEIDEILSNAENKILNQNIRIN